MMNRTIMFRLLGFIGGGVVLASAGLAAGMALATARQAANAVEPLSTVSPLISVDLPSPTATAAAPVPPSTNTSPIAPGSTPQPGIWPGGHGGWTGHTGDGDWNDWGMRPGMFPQSNATPGYDRPSGMNGSWEMQGGMMNDDWGMGGYRYMEPDGYIPQTLPGPAQPITSLDTAAQAVQAYLAALHNPDLSLAEVIQFRDGYYARVREQSTGRYAFALMVDPYTGQVWPKPGSNMNWNTWYSQSVSSANLNVTAEQARQIAQASLDLSVPGATADDPLTFSGYYTFEAWQSNALVGMVSVNSVTGQVWYHNQYGPCLDRLTVAGRP